MSSAATFGSNVRITYLNTWGLLVGNVCYWIVGVWLVGPVGVAYAGFYASALAAGRLFDGGGASLALLQEADGDLPGLLPKVNAVQLALAGLVASAFVVLAPALARYFGVPTLWPYLAIGGCATGLQMFAQTGAQLLIRSQRFAESYRIRWLSLCGQVAFLFIGLRYHESFALVIGTLGGAVTGALLYLGKTPSLRVAWAGGVSVARHVRFGGWMLVERIASFARRESDVLLLAPLVPVDTAGAYVLFRRCFQLYADATYRPVFSVMLAEFADGWRSRRPALPLLAVQLSTANWAFAVPLSLFVSVAIATLTTGSLPLAVDPAYRGAIGFAIPLAALALVQGLTTPTGAFAIGLGRPDLPAILNVGQLVLLGVGLPWFYGAADLLGYAYWTFGVAVIAAIVAPPLFARAAPGAANLYPTWLPAYVAVAAALSSLVTTASDRPIAGILVALAAIPLLPLGLRWSDGQAYNAVLGLLSDKLKRLLPGPATSHTGVSRFSA